MGRFGEDVSEKLDYTPRRIYRRTSYLWQMGMRSLRNPQAPVPAHVIDKGIPSAGPLAQVMIAKFADHLPLYREEIVFGRAGLAIPRSPLAQRQTRGCDHEFDPIGIRLIGHDPYAYMNDVLARLPKQKMSQIDELLPHKWQPA